MFPDNSWAPPTGSFKTPVLPPGVDPGSTPNQSVAINCSWLPYVRGALQQLLLQNTWKVTSPAQLALVQAQVWTLIDLFQECSGGPGYACSYDFSLSPGAWTDMGSVPLWTPAGTAQWSSIDAAWVDTDHSDGGSSFVRACDIGIVFASPVHVGAISFDFFLTKGALAVGLASVGVQMWSASFASSLYSSYVNTSTFADGNNGFTRVADVPNVSIIRVLVTADYENTTAALTGGAGMPQIFLAGPGPAPC